LAPAFSTCTSVTARQRGSAGAISFDDVYLGRSYDDKFAASATIYPQVVRDGGDNIGKAVDALVAGKVVAIYTGRMEYGPRALGNRSILASPVAREINDSINRRLDRSEFMPFAPVVLEEYAAKVFDLHAGNAYAARFMTITCAVHPSWRERIAAVVHVDGRHDRRLSGNATIRCIFVC